MSKNWKYKFSVILLTILWWNNPYSVYSQAEPLPPIINSEYDEQYPLISSDGRLLYFVRDKHPNNIGMADAPDVWVSRIQADGSWTRALHLGAPVNDQQSNRLVGTDADGDILYLAHNDGHQGWITRSTRKGRSWSPPTPMIIERFIPGGTANFSISADEQYLIIASEQEGGQGAMDLYLAFRKGEHLWSQPVSLGERINTSGQENWAMLAADEQTLYFSSDGHPNSEGGLDLWVSRRQDDGWTNWSLPQNLGPHINSTSNEGCLALSGEGKKAIFSRYKEGKGQDLMIRELPPALQTYSVAILSGQLKEAESQTVLFDSVFYEVLGKKEGKKRKLNIQADGVFKVVLPMNKAYGFYTELNGYLPLSARFSDLNDDFLDTPEPLLAAWSGQDNYYWREEAVIHQLRRQLETLSEETAADIRKLKQFRRLLAEFTFKQLDQATEGIAEEELEVLNHRYNIFVKQREDSLTSLSNTQNGRDNLINQSNAINGGDAEPSFPQERDQSAFFKPKTNPEEFDLQNLDKSKAFERSDGGFELLRQKVEKKVAIELLPGVQRELIAELFPQIWRNLEQRTDPAIFKTMTHKEDSLRAQIRAGIGNFMLTTEPSSSPSGQDSWREQLERDLKTLVRPKIGAQLKDRLRNHYRTLIRMELEHAIKGTIRATHLTDFNQKLSQQKKIENQSDEVLEFLDEELSGNINTHSQESIKFLEVNKDLYIQRIENGTIQVLHNLIFLADKSELHPTAFAELDRFSDFLQRNRNMVVEIRAHTHGLCTHEKAIELSEERAAVIIAYLQAGGVSPEQLQAKGLGKTLPILANDTLEGRLANQRIEIKILDTGKQPEGTISDFFSGSRLVRE